MPRCLLAAVAVASLAVPGRADAGAPTAELLEQARTRLMRQDGLGAVTVLEVALPDCPAADRPALLALLRQGYERAAEQAEREGHTHDAAELRENLRILNRKPRKAGPTPTSSTSPADDAPDPAPTTEPAAKPEAATEREETPVRAEASETPPVSPGNLESAEPKPPADLAAAHAAFRAKRYAEAGAIYAALARAGQLPESCRPYWAYCRCQRALERINAQPQTRQEWAEIIAEAEAIHQLAPRHWMGRYLRSLALERAAQARRPRASQMVVRGSAPEEEDQRPPLERPIGRDAGVGKAAAARPADVGRPGPRIGSWQVWETTNFRILHDDPELARKVAAIAEATRVEQHRRWAGSDPHETWSPKCDLYLYPNAETYRRMTGQEGGALHGFATIGLSDAGRVVARRINIPADNPRVLDSILPHETTHVVLADFFTARHIPRWADEGMASLADPPDVQRQRCEVPSDALASRHLFPLQVLMTDDAPAGEFWELYFAQSASVTRFLLGQGSPRQFIRFLQESQKTGYEGALRRHYRIDGIEDLQRRWLAHEQAALKPAQVAERPTEPTRR